MKERDVELRYVEIGNETSSGRYEWVYDSAKAYIESAQENYFSIKRYYPKAKIGLVVSPISFSGDHDPDEPEKPNESWPARAVQFDMESANASIGDALIIHIYAHPYQKNLEEKPNTEIERYIEIMKHFNSKFEISMNYLKALGHGKAIWLTEWGAGVLSTLDINIQDLFKKYINSPYHGLFVASALVSITLEEGVEIANYHSAGNLWDSGTDQTEITPVGNVLRLFIGAAKNSNTVYPVQAETDLNPNKVTLSRVTGFQSLENADTVYPVQTETYETPMELVSPVTGLKSLFFASGTEANLLVINEQDKAYVITRLDVGESKFNNFSVDALNIENDVFMTTKGEQKKMTDIGKSRIEIKPFSILRIRMY
jgi:hypothetical protein